MRLHKLYEIGHYEPVTYSRLHAEHIANYTRRAIDRFESKTGNEAPPELAAIFQLARRLSDQQAAELEERGLNPDG